MTAPRTILVTGGAGFIGCNFVRYVLANRPHWRVVNLDLLTYAGSLRNLQDLPDDRRHVFVRGDIVDGATVHRVLAEHEVDAVVHLAAESHVDRSIVDPAAFVRANTVGTFTLLEACRHAWSGRYDRSRFLHVSTDEVYGTLGPRDTAFTETSPYAPNSPYSATKASADHLARAYFETYRLPVVTTNSSNNYGPYQYPEKLIPLTIQSALAGKSLPVYGDGLQVRDWLWVEDHCAALCAVLENGRLGQTYNIGGGNELTNLDVVGLVCRLLDEKRPRRDGADYAEQITHVTDRPGHDRRYAIDAAKIRSELGWSPGESFESGLHKTVDWYLAHQDWVSDVMTEEQSPRTALVDAARKDLQRR